jgi:pyruvate dehydrogenase E2 component (dihydrolipoamide acetyltransferase)
MPTLSSTMTEGKIISWIKSEGDKLSKGESVVVVESDKADMDVETFYDRILAAIVVPEGESAPVGAPIGLLAETEDEIAEAKAKANSSSSTPKAITPTSPPPTSNPAPAISQPPPSPSPSPISDSPRKTVATPFAKKLAKQHKVNIESVVGTGPFSRITPADIESACFVFRLFLSQSHHVLFFFSLSHSRTCGLDKEF